MGFLVVARVCSMVTTATFPGAQTERRSGAGPVRGLLGGKTPPAALLTHSWRACSAWPLLPTTPLAPRFDAMLSRLCLVLRPLPPAEDKDTKDEGFSCC